MAKNIEVKVLGDVRPLQRSLNGASRNVKEFEGHVTKAGRGALSASGAFSHLGRSIAFASGAFLGAAGFTTVVKQSVEAAMSLNKEMSKTEAVFGKSTKAVDAWSKTTASAFGIAREDALKSANQFGQLFKVMGVGTGASVKMSKSLTELSAKLALFAGKSQEEAAAALAGGLTGRTRALKAYGIVIDQTTIKAEAMRLGLVKTAVSSTAVGEAQTRLAIAVAKAAEAHQKYAANTTQVASADLAVQRAHDAVAKAVAGVGVQLTAAQKAAAIYSLVQGQSTAASATWRREQGSAEVQMKRLHAELKDTEATIGQALLPTIVKITKSMADWLSKTQNQKQLQHDVNVVVKDATVVFGILKDIVDKMAPLVKNLNTFLGGTKHTFELLIGLGIAAKMRAIALSLGMGSGGVAAGATVARQRVGLLGKSLSGLPTKITIAILLVPQLYGPMKKFFEDHFGADFSGIAPDTTSSSGSPYPQGTDTGDAYERGKTGKSRGPHYTARENKAYEAGKKAARGGGGSTQGATGHITPGLAAVESAVGGHVNDDFATSGHAPNSYHYKGQAADLAVDRGVWNKLYANRRLFAELFGPWGLYHYGVQFYDKTLQAQHMNHIHVAYTGGPQAISRMVGGGGGAGGGATAAAVSSGGGGGALTVGSSPGASSWKGATEATIVSAKASVMSMITAANQVIGGMAGPMDAIEKAAEDHLRKLREHLHPHMTAADLARTKADIAKWGKVLNDEIAAQTKKAKRAFDAAAKSLLDSFDKETQAGLKSRAAPDETPTEMLLRQRQEARDDQARQQALADAQASGDAQAIADAEYDIQTAALEKQAAAERKAADDKATTDQEAYQTQRDAQRQSLQDQLDDWNEWLGKKMRTWNQFWAWVKSHPNGGGVPPNLSGTADAPGPGSPKPGGNGGFTQVTGGGTGGFTQVGGSNGQGGHPVLAFAKGGTVPGRIGQPQLAIVHGGETVSPSRGGGVIESHTHVYLDGKEIWTSVQREGVRYKQRNGSTGLG